MAKCCSKPYSVPLQDYILETMLVVAVVVVDNTEVSVVVDGVDSMVTDCSGSCRSGNITISTYIFAGVNYFTIQQSEGTSQH